MSTIWGVGVIVKRNRRILMYKRADDFKLWPGQWCFPGGKIEEGESVEGAASRELYEEAQIVCTKFIPVGLDLVIDQGNRNTIIVQAIEKGTYLRAQFANGRLETNSLEDGCKLKWVQQSKVYTLDLIPPTRNFINAHPKLMTADFQELETLRRLLLPVDHSKCIAGRISPKR